MPTVIHDVRYALRTLSRNPGFTVVALLTLTLGIGANTAVFSVVNAVLLRPLPYEDPDRLALVWTNFGPDLPQNWISGPEFAEMQEFNTSFESIGVAVPFTVSVTGGGEPEQVNAAAASGNLFEVLRAQPARGRLFTASDDRPGAELVAVISDGYWKRRFGADPRVVGQTINANGQEFTIVGVLRPDFEILHPDAQFPNQIDVWGAVTPLFSGFFGRPMTYAELPRGSHGLRGFGRMKPGVTLAQAQADMDAVARAMLETTPDYYGRIEGWGLTVYSMHGDLVEEVRPALIVLMGAVGFVLLIACVNVANLMLARAAVREREIAVRTALGAGRGRLLQQLLTESVVLSLIGGVTGLVAALGAVRMLVALAPADLPRRADIGIDPSVLVFTVVVSLLTGIVFGLAPALHSVRDNLVEAFKEGGRGTSTGRRGGRMRTSLVVTEVALALVLLVGAGLLIRSFARLTESDPGYRTDGLLTLQVALPGTRYAGTDVVAFWDRLLAQTAGLPGVEAVGAISHLPLSGAYASGTTRVERSSTLPEDQRAIEADRRWVSAGYFETMGVQLLRGRAFTAADGPEAPLVAVVDEQFVARFWPNDDPIGQRVSINGNADGRVWREVVGIVRHSKHYNLDTVGREQVYIPYQQQPVNTMFLVVRTAGDPSALAASVRGEVWAIDADQPVADVATMAGRVGAAVSQPRFNLLVLAVFAGVALVLAAVGIYGVIAYAVSQRRHEIGVRLALGAERRDVIRLVLRQGLVPVGTGMAIGVVAALGLTRLIANLLFDVSAADPLTYLAVAGALGVTGVLACYLPARRATRFHPVEVLTSE